VLRVGMAYFFSIEITGIIGLQIKSNIDNMAKTKITIVLTRPRCMEIQSVKLKFVETS
jgi:hypothetical protein